MTGRELIAQLTALDAAHPGVLDRRVFVEVLFEDGACNELAELHRVSPETRCDGEPSLYLWGDQSLSAPALESGSLVDDDDEEDCLG